MKPLRTEGTETTKPPATEVPAPAVPPPAPPLPDGRPNGALAAGLSLQEFIDSEGRALENRLRTWAQR